MLVDKNLSKGINKFLNPKGPQMRCIPHGRRGLAQFLDQLPLKTRFTKEKRTLETLVVCREANYRAANKLVLTKI